MPAHFLQELRLGLWVKDTWGGQDTLPPALKEARGKGLPATLPERPGEATGGLPAPRGPCQRRASGSGGSLHWVMWIDRQRGEGRSKHWGPEAMECKWDHLNSPLCGWQVQEDTGSPLLSPPSAEGEAVFICRVHKEGGARATGRGLLPGGREEGV